MSTSRGKLFYADAAKGYTIKVLIDVLAGPLSRTNIHLAKDGIFIRATDTKGYMLFSLGLYRRNFRSYRCKKETVISLNLKHLQKIVKNVKKKDSMTLFIDNKNHPGKLGIAIRPEGGTTRKSTRTEIMYITIQECEDVTHIDTPETYKDPNDPDAEPVDVYKHPMVIEAPDFQKIKKFSSIGKEVTVKIQGSNYISFYCDAGEIFSDEISFGELCDNLDSETDESDDETETGTSDTVTEGESESEEETDDSDVETEDYPGMYQANFYINTFTLLVKLPGLCNQMQFYSPSIDHFPLKISMNAGPLGDISIFIKDIQQIVYEESMKAK